MARLDTIPPFGPRPGSHPFAASAGEGAAHAEPSADGKVRPSDAQLASAFRDLEGSIADLKCMSALMDTAAEDTVRQRGGPLQDFIHKKAGLDGYQIHVLTEEQDDALNYALYHLQDLIRNLHAKYYAGFEKQAAS